MGLPRGEDERAVMAYYETHWHDRMTDRATKAADWALLAAAGGVAGKDVVDLGCGYPHDALRWVGEARSWTLVDWCLLALTKALAVVLQEGILLHTALADIRALREEWQASFDMVLCFGTLTLIPTGRDRVHAEAFRILRPGGGYLLTVPDQTHFGFAERSGPEVCGYMATWTPEQLGEELRAAGFVVRELQGDTGARLSAWAEKPWGQPEASPLPLLPPEPPVDIPSSGAVPPPAQAPDRSRHGRRRR